MNARFDPGLRLRGRVSPPADKSISHRAAIIGAMASEPVRVVNYLDAADTRSTLAAVGRLGALVERHDDEVRIRGVGMRNAQPPTEPIDVGNAGTLMRLLPGWLAFQQGAAFTLDGDASIRRRPVDRIAEPLERMGARIEARDGRHGFRSTLLRMVCKAGHRQHLSTSRRSLGTRLARALLPLPCGQTQLAVASPQTPC